jgi:Tfp pilus assembly ATPase PilU
MKKFAAMAVLLGLCAVPSLFAGENFKDVPVVDVNCSAKVAADPDSHTRACALKCEASGFGIVTMDKKFLKFDVDGNKKIVEALKASDKKDHLRVDVSGDVKGDTLQVTSIKLL